MDRRKEIKRWEKEIGERRLRDVRRRRRRRKEKGGGLSGVRFLGTGKGRNVKKF